MEESLFVYFDRKDLTPYRLERLIMAEGMKAIAPVS